MSSNDSNGEPGIRKFRDFILLILGSSSLFIGVSYFFGIITIAKISNLFGFGTSYIQSSSNIEIVIVYGFSLAIYWLLFFLLFIIVFGTILTILLSIKCFRKKIERTELQLINTNTYTYFVKIPILILVFLSFGILSIKYTYTKFDLYSTSLARSIGGYHEVQIIEPKLNLGEHVYFYESDCEYYYLFTSIDPTSCKPTDLLHVKRDDIVVIKFLPIGILLPEKCSQD